MFIRSLFAVLCLVALSGCAGKTSLSIPTDPNMSAPDRARLRIEAEAQAFQTKVDADLAKVRANFVTQLQNLSKFSVADLQAAAASAHDHDDPEAEMCWSGLVPIVQALQTPAGQPAVPKIIGGATLAQAIRNLVHGNSMAGSQNTVARQINLSCGALYVSARGDAIKVAAMLAASGVAPGAPAIVGAIPASLSEAVNLLIQTATKIR